MYYQGIETCRFGFEVKNEVKEPETKFLLVFKAMNKAR